MRRVRGSVFGCSFLLVAWAVGCGGNSSERTQNATLADRSGDDGSLDNNTPFSNPNGSAATDSFVGSVDLTGLFFQSLGTNGRSCGSCHTPSDGWTVTPASIRARFDATDGMDPIFRTNDGSNCPTVDVSTVAARRAGYSMLLTKGLIRVEMAVPATAEFELVAVDDPYAYATASGLSLYRRPLPATNLRFLSTVMWDGRETLQGEPTFMDLVDQSNAATLGHAQAQVPLTTAQAAAIVTFEFLLSTAQVTDNDAKDLTARGALGGPAIASVLPFWIGINDNPHNPNVFTLYDAWNNVPGGGTEAARRSVARGEALFNSKNCQNCHETPNVGNSSVGKFMNLGIADASRRTPDLPLYTFANKSTGATVQTTDPGRALVTGSWADIGKFKVPVLRGLSARAPYFHNGFAASIDDVVNFYNGRFNLGLSAQDHADLVAFLGAL